MLIIMRSTISKKEIMYDKVACVFTSNNNGKAQFKEVDMSSLGWNYL